MEERVEGRLDVREANGLFAFRAADLNRDFKRAEYLDGGFSGLAAMSTSENRLSVADREVRKRRRRLLAQQMHLQKFGGVFLTHLIIMVCEKAWHERLCHVSGVGAPKHES